MTRLFLSLTGLLMATALSATEPLSIDGPDSISLDGSPVVLTLHGLPEGPLESDAWNIAVFPTQGCQITAPLRWKGSTYLLAKATLDGRYSVVIYHAAPEGLVHCFHQLSTGLIPPPDPVPPPTPPDPPEPTPGPRWYVLIYESATDGPLVKELLNSQSFADSLNDSGSHWLAFDRNAVDSSDQTPHQLTPFLQAAGDDHPILFITDTQGLILWQGTPPKTPAEVLALVPLPQEPKPNE